MLLFSFSVSIAYAGSYRDDDIHLKAEKNMIEGNFAISYCLWSPLAEAGDPKAQFNIGWMYHNGYGLAISDELALKWWLSASEQGHVESLFALSELYLEGFSVSKSPDIAMGWVIEAAIKGHPNAIEAIQALYSHDDKKSKKYFKLILESSPQLLGKSQKVSVPKANIRRGPSTDFKVIKTLSQDDEVIVLAKKGNWSHIGLPNTQITAWVFSQLIATEEDLNP